MPTTSRTIRVTFGFDPTGQIEKILEENHYYPFGLKHTNYNDNISDFIKKQEGPGISIEELAFGQIGAYRYKYQEQERQSELGLNWDSFKWRNYDYAIGRFMSVDPLAEKYNTWSPYVFSGNRVIDAREIEGLEPHILFNSRDGAAKNFGQQYNGKSIIKDREIGATIYSKTARDGKTYYGYNEPKVSEFKDRVQFNHTLREGEKRSAVIHTHGAYDLNLEEGNDKFSNETSEDDKPFADRQKVSSYLVGTNGGLYLYESGREEPVPSEGIPSDPNNPKRKNQVEPTLNPKPVKTTPIKYNKIIKTEKD